MRTAKQHTRNKSRMKLRQIEKLSAGYTAERRDPAEEAETDRMDRLLRLANRARLAGEDELANRLLQLMYNHRRSRLNPIG